MQGDPNTASLDAGNGVVTAGRKPGSVRVHDDGPGGKCYDDVIDVVDCDSCGNALCPATAQLGSVDGIRCTAHLLPSRGVSA